MSKQNLLWITDDGIDPHLMKLRALYERDVGVTIVTDNLSGLQHAGAKRWDWILYDVGMDVGPTNDHLAIADRLKRTKSESTPLVAVSMQISETRYHDIQEYFDGVIHESIGFLSPEDFLAELRKYMNFS